MYFYQSRSSCRAEMHCKVCQVSGKKGFEVLHEALLRRARAFGAGCCFFRGFRHTIPLFFTSHAAYARGVGGGWEGAGERHVSNASSSFNAAPENENAVVTEPSSLNKKWEGRKVKRRIITNLRNGLETNLYVLNHDSIRH